MTGYGQAELEQAGIRVKCELRALNGKYFEADIRLPKFLYELDPELRKMLSDELERGTITCIYNIDFQHAESNTVDVKINTVLAKAYYGKLLELSRELGLEFKDPFREIAGNTDIINLAETGISEETRELVRRATFEAAMHLTEHRLTEGSNIVLKLLEAVSEIGVQLKVVEGHEEARRNGLREKIYANLAEHLKSSLPDQSRFEQELLLYLEKWDITEEKNRLKQHLDYFGSCLKNEPMGKKLNFIAQEMGREINTMGVKSNHYPMQQATVLMKEQLEQIKEQVLNLV